MVDQFDKEIQQRVLEIQKKFKEIQPIERIVPYSSELVFKYSKGIQSTGLEQLREDISQITTDDTTSKSSSSIMAPEDNQDWGSQIVTLRLGFLNIGPSIHNLNVNFASLTTLFLQYNKLANLTSDAFIKCPNLKFLALQHNLIEKFFELRYLKQLEFLDLSNNKISQQEAHLLPVSLMVLKLQGNPLANSGTTKFAYRREFVLALGDLEEFDKINVLPAERLSYQGQLPKLNINKLLKEQEDKMIQEESNQRLDIELQQQIRLDTGISSKQLMIESLDEFGKLDEFAEMDNIVGGMLAKATANQQETNQITQIRKQRIQKELDEVSKKYGRVMTPSTSKSSVPGRKAASLEPEQF